MHRFYGDPDRIVDDTAFLMEEEARHAVSVLRLRKGDHIEIILNEERYESEIVSAGSREVCVRILALLPSAEPHLRITLYRVCRNQTRWI